MSVLRISKILFEKFRLSRINFMKQAFTYFYQNILQSQGQISKILNVYAEFQNQTIQQYLQDVFTHLIDELVDESSLISERTHLS
jgi:hypothetical protein